MSFARHRSLVKPFEPSSRAAAALGPNTAIPAAAQRIGHAGDQRRLGADHDEVDGVARRASSTTAAGSHGSTATQLRPARDPGIARRGDELAAARRLPKAPGERILATARPQEQNIHGPSRRHESRPVSERRPRRQFARAQRHRTVGRAQADGRERLRPRPGARRDQRVQAPRLGPLLFHAEGRECVHRRGDLARAAPPRSPSAPRTASRSSRPASSPLTPAVRNIRSSSTGWRLRARGRCSPCSKSAARRSPPRGCSIAERKRRLPFLPRVIGVVTSPTGAVIRDILHRLEDRCPTRVILWPVPVQGEGAAAKVAAAIRAFPSIEPRPDLSSSLAAAGRSRICGPSTRRRWSAPLPNRRSRSSPRWGTRPTPR